MAIFAALGLAQDRPEVAIAIGVAALAAGLATHLPVREAPVLAVLVLTPIVPVTDAGYYNGVVPGAESLRSGMIAALCIVGALVIWRDFPKLSARPAVVSLGWIAIAGFGAVAAIVNATTFRDLVDELVRAAGQPGVFGVALMLFALAAAKGRSAGDRLLMAICLALVIQGLLVFWELASGGAFDAIRGYTRAQGTVGSNFLGAFAMVGAFAAAALLRRAQTDRVRHLALGALVASAFLVVAAVSRGALVGAAVGGLYLALVNPRVRVPALVGAVVLALAYGAGALRPVERLWEDRLGSSASFDRTSTWVAGLRIVRDDPLTGFGRDGVVEAILTDSSFSETPYGVTTVVPHNSWLLGFAENGVGYFLGLLATTAAAIWAVVTRPARGSPGDRFLIAGLLAFVAVNFVNNLFTHPELMLPVLAMLAVLIAPPSGLRTESLRSS